MMLGFPEVGSPKYGEILIVSDFERFAVKVIIAAEGSKISTEIPILENVTDREYYGEGTFVGFFDRSAFFCCKRSVSVSGLPKARILKGSVFCVDAVMGSLL